MNGLNLLLHSKNIRQLYRYNLLLSACFLISFSIQAQTAALSGIVTDLSTGEGLYPATIKVGSTGTITDFDGKYEIKLEKGIYQIEVSYVGYETHESTISLSGQSSIELDIELSEAVNLLQTATVTTGRYEKPLGETTVSLEVLKSDLIESTNATSLDQTLDKIPGVNMLGQQANIRGGSGFTLGAGSRVLVLVNDLPALQADLGTSHWDDLPVESIEQVEVVKGAASALYGSSALNGIFNVRTAYARSEPETKVSLFGGIYNNPKDISKKWWEDGDLKYEAGMLFSHKQKINKLDLVIGGRLFNREDPREGFFTAQARGTLGLRYRISDRLNIGFNATYNQQASSSYLYWKDHNEGIYRAGDTALGSFPIRFYVDPFISYFDKAGNRHKLSTRYYNVKNKLEKGRIANGSDQLYGEYQFQRVFESIDLVLTTGLVGASTAANSLLYGDTSYVFTNNAAYLQLDKKVGERLNLSGGFRYEQNKIIGPSTLDGFSFADGTFSDARPVFRFGMNYQVQPTLFLRASWGQGFRFPTIAEKYINVEGAGLQIFPNPDLSSETGWSSEVGVKQGFNVNNWFGFLDIAAFWMEYQDMIEFGIRAMRDSDGMFRTGLQAQNIGNTIIRGMDISVTGQGDLGPIPVSLLAGYTFIDPKFKEFTQEDNDRSSVDFNILKYRSKHSVKVDIEGAFGSFKLGIALIRNSHMIAMDDLFETSVVSGLDVYRAENNNGFYLWNARVSYQLTKKMKLAFLVNNLTNAEFTTRPGLLEPTRLWNFRLDYVFGKQNPKKLKEPRYLMRD